MNYARPAFLQALMPFLDPHVAKFNKRCVSVGRASSGRQVMHFGDDTTYEADLVIGADGIKSITRKAVVSDSRLGFSNTCAYRGLIPIDTLKLAGIKTDIQSRPHCWVGFGRVIHYFTWDSEPKLTLHDHIQHMITFPIKDNTVVCLICHTG